MSYAYLGRATPGEIQTIVDVEAEKEMDFYRVMAWIGYNCASLIGVAVNAPKKFPTLEQAFPSLFEQKEQQDWRVMKERIERFAAEKAREVKSHPGGRR